MPNSPSLDAANLPTLTDKQRKYVYSRMAGKTQADSIRAATDTSKWSNAVVWSESHKYENHHKIRMWMEAVKAAQLEAGAYTLTDHLQELDHVKRIAMETNNIGAAAAAVNNKGKAAGLYINRYEDVTPSRAEDVIPMLQQLIEQMVRVSPDFRAWLRDAAAEPIEVIDRLTDQHERVPRLR